MIKPENVCFSDDSFYSNVDLRNTYSFYWFRLHFIACRISTATVCGHNSIYSINYIFPLLCAQQRTHGLALPAFFIELKFRMPVCRYKCICTHANRTASRLLLRYLSGRCDKRAYILHTHILLYNYH